MGFGCFAVAPGIAAGCGALFVGGYGIGLVITATNILAGRRFTTHRGSALSLLNFSFSLGAMLSALLAAWLLPWFTLRSLLEWFAGTFVLVTAVLLLEMRGAVVRGARVDGPEVEIRKGLEWTDLPLLCWAAASLWRVGDVPERMADDFCAALRQQNAGHQRVHDAVAYGCP